MNRSKKHSWENKYRELEIIGKGGNAAIYLVENENSDKYVLKDLISKRSQKKVNRFKKFFSKLRSTMKSCMNMQNAGL